MGGLNAGAAKKIQNSNRGDGYTGGKKKEEALGNATRLNETKGRKGNI